MSWYRIDKTITGLTKNLLLGVVYIPPEGFKYTNVCAFEECESELLELLSCNDALVYMCGDVFNDFGSDSATGGLSTRLNNHHHPAQHDTLPLSRYN